MLTRTTKTKFEVKDKRRLTWYAAVFGVPTQIVEMDHGRLVRYQEVITSTAFDESLASNTEVLANLEHDAERTFATRSSGKLILQSDPYGLFCSCWMPSDVEGDMILERVKAGELDGSSFQFMPVKDHITNTGVVERHSVKLFDVCLTGNPAYESTRGEVMLRTVNPMAFLSARYRYAKIKNWCIDSSLTVNNGAA